MLYAISHVPTVLPKFTVNDSGLAAETVSLLCRRATLFPIVEGSGLLCERILSQGGGADITGSFAPLWDMHWEIHEKWQIQIAYYCSGLFGAVCQGKQRNVSDT